MSRSNWTGRTPRSLDQAFGPYCTPFVQPAEKQSRRDEVAFVIACIACAVAGLLATYWS